LVSATASVAFAQPGKRDASDDFFDQGMIPQIKITVSEKEMAKWRGNIRAYVSCSIEENGKTTYDRVSIKAKGAAGSFRDINDRPALTLNFARENKGQRFHELHKIHLNNSVQDDTYISEWLCAQLCREAGLPAARATHARVWLNGRDLGMYGLKEGFDDYFLSRHFANPKGNLYDGGFCVDIDSDLEKDEGKAPHDKADLKALVAACREGDPAKKWPLIEQRLDVDAFLNFVAIELMSCHWDGYVQNRNNYRVYFNPANSKAYFFPHGMDQMFGDPNFSVFHQPGQIVPSQVLSHPEWKARYRERVKALLPLYAPDKLNAKIDQIHARLRPVFAAISEDRAKHFDNQAKGWKDRLAHRAKIIQDQMRAAPPTVTIFTNNQVLLDEWFPGPNPGDAKLDDMEHQGKKLLPIYVGPSNRSTASWRRKVLLSKGTYRFEAVARTTAVTAIEDVGGRGFGVRLSGQTMTKGYLVGTTNWTPLTLDIEIPEPERAIEIVAELRATAGKAWLDTTTLKLVKIK
jgi:hypothetical protein